MCPSSSPPLPVPRMAGPPGGPEAPCQPEFRGLPISSAPAQELPLGGLRKCWSGSRRTWLAGAPGPGEQVLLPAWDTPSWGWVPNRPTHCSSPSLPRRKGPQLTRSARQPRETVAATGQAPPGPGSPLLESKSPAELRGEGAARGPPAPGLPPPLAGPGHWGLKKGPAHRRLWDGEEPVTGSAPPRPPLGFSGAPAFLIGELAGARAHPSAAGLAEGCLDGAPPAVGQRSLPSSLRGPLRPWKLVGPHTSLLRRLRGGLEEGGEAAAAAQGAPEGHGAPPRRREHWSCVPCSCDARSASLRGGRGRGRQVGDPAGGSLTPSSSFHRWAGQGPSGRPSPPPSCPEPPPRRTRLQATRPPARRTRTWGRPWPWLWPWLCSSFCSRPGWAGADLPAAVADGAPGRPGGTGRAQPGMSRVGGGGG